MDWVAFATKLPLVVQGAVKVAQAIKDAKGHEKKDAVLKAIPESVELAEYAVGKDLLKDDAIAALIHSYIDAEAAALKARDTLKAGILAKQPAA